MYIPRSVYVSDYKSTNNKALCYRVGLTFNSADEVNVITKLLRENEQRNNASGVSVVEKLSLGLFICVYY